MTRLKNHNQFVIIVLLLAWIFDFLFWRQQPGITIPLFVFFLVISGMALLYREGMRPAWQSLILLGPISFFAAAFAVRLEPMTQLMSLSMLFVFMVGTTLTLRSGFWLRYSLLDWILGSIKLAWAAISGGLSLRSQKVKSEEENVEQAQNTSATEKRSAKRIRPILLGILFALPIVLLFGSILALADPVFARLLNEWIAIDRWSEYIWRISYILILAYLLAGLYLFTLFKSQERKLIEIGQSGKFSVLGWTEAMIILTSVNVLFLIFVGVQFHYFFGGQINIHIEGFTYSEYARRGFFELVLVAILSLGLILTLGTISLRKDELEKRIFSILNIVLVVLIGIMLYSAYLRLGMYEMAYGFTRLRTYTHVFMIWLGVLLVLTVILETIRRPRFFASALLFVSIGFSASLALMNVDAFIVRQNVSRSQQGHDLDVHYLTQLSDDAIPVVAELFAAEQNQETKATLGAVLACRNSQNRNKEMNDWRSFHFSRAKSDLELRQLATQLERYEILDGEVRDLAPAGKIYPCGNRWW